MSSVADQNRHSIAVKTLLAQVFTAPNTCRYPVEPSDQSVQATAVRAVAASLVRLLKWDTQWPVFAPFLREGDVRTTWYAWTSDESHARALLDELTAFVGRSYAEVYREPAVDDSERHIEKLFLSLLGGRVIRFRASRASDEAALRKQLELYLDVLAKRPSAAPHVPQSFAQLRARFDRALLARDEQTARATLAELRNRRLLSAENHKFLEIRLAAGLGQWEAVASHPLLRSLAHLRLPIETYGDIIEALYWTHLRVTEQESTLDELIRLFDRHIFQTVPELFRTRRTSRRPAVIKSFLLRELSQPEPDASICADLFAALPSSAFGESLRGELVARLRDLASPRDERLALDAYDREEFDRAFALYRTLPPTSDILCRLLRCAREIDDPAIADDVVKLCAEASAPTQALVQQKSPVMWRLVHERVAGFRRRTQQATWSSRFNWNQESGETVEEYVARLREGVQSWDPREVLGETGIGSALADTLERFVLEVPEVFDQVFPLWFEFFIDRTTPVDPRIVPLYQAFVSTLRAREALGENELALIKGAAASGLGCAVSAQRYRAFVDELSGIFVALRAPKLVDWALDVSDVLLISPCPEPEVRLRFVTGALQLVKDSALRLTRTQLALAEFVANDAGIAMSFGADQVPEATNAVLPEKVAVYTLDEAAGKRAGQLLTKVYPRLRVDVRSDSVCSKQLQQLAKSVDVFLFAWKSAKHQAFWCVKDAVRPGTRLSMARGAGTTSLVRAFEDAMRLSSRH